MTALVSVHEWLGRRGDPLEPESMQFTTRASSTCRGCLFEGQPVSVCTRACDVARRAELDHCEAGFVYVAKEVDPRQADLLRKEHCRA